MLVECLIALIFLVCFRVDGLHCILITDRDGAPVLKGRWGMGGCAN
jgi:hypothetical protein